MVVYFFGQHQDNCFPCFQSSYLLYRQQSDIDLHPTLSARKPISAPVIFKNMPVCSNNNNNNNNNTFVRMICDKDLTVDYFGINKVTLHNSSVHVQHTLFNKHFHVLPSQVARSDQSFVLSIISCLIAQCLK